MKYSSRHEWQMKKHVAAVQDKIADEMIDALSETTLTLDEVAERMGVKRKDLDRVLKHRNGLTVPFLIRFCSALRLNLNVSMSKPKKRSGRSRARSRPDDDKDDDA